MAFQKITAIVRESQIPQITQRLQQLGVPGLSLHPVRGYGEYENDYSFDGLVEHIQIEIFIQEEVTQIVIDALCEEAYTGLSGDGIIAVSDIRELIHVRDNFKDTRLE